MHFDLTADQSEIRDVARHLLEQRVTADRRRQIAEGRRSDEALWTEMRDLGWSAITLDEADGGLGLGLVEASVLLEEQGAALAPVPLLPVICVVALLRRDGDVDQRSLLPAVADGRIAVAVGTRTSAGHAVVAGASEPDLVLTIEDDGVSLLRGADLQRAEPAPFPTIDPLRAYSRLGGGGEPLPGNWQRGLREAEVALAAELLGIARRSLDLTLPYVKERRQFGVPVGAFQAVAHRCADMLFAVESARSAVYAAAWSADADDPGLDRLAPTALLVAGRAALHNSASAIQAHGGVGFSWEADPHWLYKRAQASAHLLGSLERRRFRLGELASA